MDKNAGKFIDGANVWDNYPMLKTKKIYIKNIHDYNKFSIEYKIFHSVNINNNNNTITIVAYGKNKNDIQEHENKINQKTIEENELEIDNIDIYDDQDEFFIGHGSM